MVVVVVVVIDDDDVAVGMSHPQGVSARSQSISLYMIQVSTVRRREEIFALGTAIAGAGGTGSVFYFDSTTEHCTVRCYK
jgi:hypothetical protein